MRYGYIRVSDTGLTVEEQTRLLLDAGCDRLFTDLTRDGHSSQDAFEDMLKAAKPKDTIVVAKLERFGGALRPLLDTLTALLEREVALVSLAEKIDTQKDGYSILLKTLQHLRDFDNDRTKERNKVGLRSARARGKLGGRPRKMDKSKASMAKSLYRDKKHSIHDICDIMQVSRATLYRYLK